jgi:arylsulfatase A-like enzyme
MFGFGRGAAVVSGVVGAALAALGGTALAPRLEAAAAVPEVAAGAEAKRPNILFVILDDVGIDQLGTFGYGGLLPPRTPNLDTIADAGVRFSNAWAMPECSPSRSAFFTGRYPIRTGVISAIVSNHIPQSYLSSFETTLPRVLETAGYKSALIGKYHLGDSNDPSGNCAPASRGFQAFRGNMTAGPPSIDTTGGGVSKNLVCGYVQSDLPGGCYEISSSGQIGCSVVDLKTSDRGTSPARTCLQRGGIFTAGKACGALTPTRDDFDRNNAYYVWPRLVTSGKRGPYATSDSCGEAETSRTYMTTAQTDDAASWWKRQVGPRMLTLSYNTMHTPFQKAPTYLVPDPQNDPSTCSSLLPPRQLLDNMLHGADVEIGRMLAEIGAATLKPDGKTIATLDLSNTAIVIIGDNGSFGSTVRAADGFDVGRSKGFVYQTGVWVPLIVAGPFVQKPGRTVDDMVNAVDLFHLFGSIAGVDVAEAVPPAHALDAQPMMPYLTKPGTDPIRKTNYAEVGAGTYTPKPSQRSWPCLIGSLCNDTLIDTQSLCLDNGGTWYGPGGASEATSCCAVIANIDGGTIIPPRQYAVRDKSYKLVEMEETDCSAPLKKGQTPAFPWAEYQTRTVREFYDIRPTADNPLGLDQADADYLAGCKDDDPARCLPKSLRDRYRKLASTLDGMQRSAKAEATCQAAGDGNMDLRVNRQDIEGWKRLNGRGPSRYDINVDAKTNSADLAIIRANQGLDCLDQCTRADLNRDGKVNVTDKNLIGASKGSCGGLPCGGDLNGDDVVNREDTALLDEIRPNCPPNWVQEAAPAGAAVGSGQ